MAEVQPELIVCMQATRAGQASQLVAGMTSKLALATKVISPMTGIMSGLVKVP